MNEDPGLERLREAVAPAASDFGMRKLYVREPIDGEGPVEVHAVIDGTLGPRFVAFLLRVSQTLGRHVGGTVSTSDKVPEEGFACIYERP